MKNTNVCFSEIEIDFSSGQEQLLRIFVKELLAWNKHTNLTGLSSTQAIMDELVADSLMPIPYLPDTGRCLDVGSGAGFPAIPLKICKPDITFFLMEPNLKKGSFLKQIIRLCGLKGIEIIRDRMETCLDPSPFTQYDMITSRAMAPLPKLIGWCIPYLAPGGLMIAFLGNQFEEILTESEPLLKEKGLLVHDSKPYSLRGKDLKRNLLILKKQK